MTTMTKLSIMLLLIVASEQLSPIQIGDKPKDEIKSPEVSDKTSNNIVDAAKVVEADSDSKGLEYDSLDDIHYIDDNEESLARGKKNIKKWDHWGKWTDCSVTCGVGKMTRWRHCVSAGCADGEKEAQIKTCTLQPCT